MSGETGELSTHVWGAKNCSIPIRHHQVVAINKSIRARFYAESVSSFWSTETNLARTGTKTLLSFLKLF